MGRSARLFRAAIVLIACLGGVLSPMPAFAQVTDPQVVFCLSPKHETDLYAAAVALRLPVPAKTSQLAGWEIRDPADFTRACEALYAAEGPIVPDSGSAGWFETALPFLTGVFGAVLGYGATALQNRQNRGVRLGDELRSALEDFYEIARRSLDLNGTGPPEDDLIQRRGQLVAHLATVRAERPRWSVVDALYDELTSGDLGEPALSIDRTQNTSATRAHRDAVKTKLETLRQTGQKVAVALTRTLRPYPGLATRNGAGAP
jgi:hypothetical protein